MVSKKVSEGSSITLDYDSVKEEKEQIPIKTSIRKSRKK
jgi:hypothetical protein